MKRGRVVRTAGAGLLLLLAAWPAWGATGSPGPGGSWLPRLFVNRPGENDVFLTISSIEWGPADRWSFTSRYGHMFGTVAERNVKPWLSGVGVSLSPGTAGGRLGIGYQGYFTRKGGSGGSDLALLNEARVVLLRTWGDPLVTRADRTFVGGEIRSSLAGLVNVGVGWYRQVPVPEDGRRSFWGVHAGIGL